jgi:hypothetical protein
LNRVFLTAAAFLLAASCAEPPGDRIVTGDGENITGTLASLGGGSAVFESGVSVPVPAGIARVYMTNGASVRGEVTLENGEFRIHSAHGESSHPAGDVSAVVWGADHAQALLFDVHAGAGWQNTHLEVERNDFLSITAVGTVTTQTGTSGPGGLDEFSTTSALVPTATGGELVMRIGTENQPVAAGASWTGSAYASGELFLAVNFPDQDVPDVTGVYTVSITAGEGPGRGSVAVYPAPQ